MVKTRSNELTEMSSKENRKKMKPKVIFNTKHVWRAADAHLVYWPPKLP